MIIKKSVVVDAVHYSVLLIFNVKNEGYDIIMYNCIKELIIYNWHTSKLEIEILRIEYYYQLINSLSLINKFSKIRGFLPQHLCLINYTLDTNIF